MTNNYCVRVLDVFFNMSCLFTILVISLVVSGCASPGKRVSSLSGSSFTPAVSGFEFLRQFQISEESDLLMGESGIYEYTVEGLQKRPVLRKLYPSETLKGVKADKIRPSLKAFNLSRKPFTPVVSSICKSSTHQCAYLRNTQELITQSSDGKMLEIAQLGDVGIDENEESLIGSTAYLNFKHKDLYTAIENDDLQAESAIIATLDERLEHEKLWLRFKLPRHKELLIGSLRAKSTVASQIRVFELTGAIEDFKQGERIAQAGGDQDKSILNNYSTKALTVFLGADEQNSANHILDNYTDHIDFVAILEKYDNELVRQRAIRHYRLVATAPSLIDAFRLTENTEDLVNAQKNCLTAVTCKEVQKTLLEKLKDLGLEIVIVDQNSASTDYNRSVSESGIVLAQTKTSRKNIGIETAIRLNPEVASIGILDAAYLEVQAEVKLDKMYTYTDNIYGKNTEKTYVSKENVTAVLSPENNFSSMLTAHFRVTEYEVIGSKLLEKFADIANEFLGTDTRADIVQELKRVNSTVRIIDVTVK